MDANPFVFENVPDLEFKEDLLDDYFGAILPKEAKTLEFLSAVPDRTLVTFSDDDLDIDETNQILQKNPLQEACLKVAEAIQQNNAVVLDRRQYSDFESYLESHVKGGKKVVQQVFLVPGSELIAVCISNPDALESIFRQKEVKVQPFFRNFHGRIQLDGKMLAETIEEAGKPAKSPSKSPSKLAWRKTSPPLPPKPQIATKPKSPPKSPPEDEKKKIETTEVAATASGGEDKALTNLRNKRQQPAVKKLAEAFMSWSIQKITGGNGKDAPVSRGTAPSVPGDRESPERQSTDTASQNEKSKEKPIGEDEKEKNDGECQRIKGEDIRVDEDSPDEDSDNIEGAEEDTDGTEEDTSDSSVEEDGESKEMKNTKESHQKAESPKFLQAERKSPQPERKSPQPERKSPQPERKSPQLERKSFSLRKSRNLHRTKSREEEPTAKSTGEKPKLDTLFIDEHRWKLIEGKLDKSRFHSLKYKKDREILKFQSLNPEECKEAIEDLDAGIIEGTPLRIPDHLRAMFLDLQKKDFFHSCAEDYFQNFEIQIDIQDNSILFYGWDAENVDKTKKEIQQRFMHTEEMDNENGMDVSHLKQIKKELESEFMVNISWNDTEASKILIQGVFDDISFAEASLKEAMNKYKNRTSSFKFSCEHASFIRRHRHYKLEMVLQKVKVSFQGDRDGKYVIEYSGKMDDVTGVAKALNQMQEDIAIDNINVFSHFDAEMGELFTKAVINKKDNDPFSTMQNNFEMNAKCCILYDYVKPEPSSAKGPKPKPRRKDASEKQSISVQMSSSLIIDIRPSGDITKEKADALVSPLHESGALKKLNISKAFHFADSSLQEKVQKFDFSSSQVHCCKMTYRDSGIVKDVVFVVLTPWKKDTPENYLQQLITETLLKVSELGVKTVAFPPIGLGVMMKFPANVIAKAYFSAITDYMGKTPSKAALNRIEILACDRELYKELQGQSDKFQTLPKRKKRGVGMDEEAEPDHSLPVVTMKIIRGQSDKSVASRWKEKFNSCVWEDEYRLKSPIMPGNLEGKLKKEMRKMVLAMKKDETESEELVLKFTGLNEDILKIKTFIVEEIHRPSHIISDHSPPRGTVEFIQYASSIDELAPPYWTHQTPKSLGLNDVLEVEVDDDTQNAIKNLFLNTFDSSRTGIGNDAKGIPKQSKVEFVSVKRIENFKKYRAYHGARKALFEKKAGEKEICKSLSEVSPKLKGCQLDDYLSDDMKDFLCHEINECYLLHGTKPEIVETIKLNGCDPNVSSVGAMFGKGVYAAECSTKADQYTDPMDNRLPSGSLHYAFLLRMLLGDIFICDDKHQSVQSRDSVKLNRPPCKSCGKDRCGCISHYYDSVVGEGKWIFREFIVYRDYLVYPEYLITYKRI